MGEWPRGPLQEETKVALFIRAFDSSRWAEKYDKVARISTVRGFQARLVKVEGRHAADLMREGWGDRKGNKDNPTRETPRGSWKIQAPSLIP